MRQPAKRSKSAKHDDVVHKENQCQRRREAWRAENRPALLAWNRWVEQNGIPFEEIAVW